MSAFSRSSRGSRCPAQTDTEWRTVSRKEWPSKEKSKACYQCGGPHLARDCPTASEFSKQCYRCGGSHLARNCSLPYKVDKFISGGQRLAHDRKEVRNDASLKPGDWLCPSCGDHQFARNAECRMCGAAKPGDGGAKSISERRRCREAEMPCSIEEDDEIVSKSDRPVASPKKPPFADMVKPDSLQTSTKPFSGGGGKPSWADIVDEEEEKKEASRRKTPSNSASTGASDASSQADDSPSEDCVLPGQGSSQADDSPSEDCVLPGQGSSLADDSPSEDCVLPGSQSDTASFPAWQQFWEDPTTCFAGNGLVNDQENLNGALGVSQLAPMNQMVMCGSTWPGMWWPTYSQDTLQPMQQCPHGHQLVDGVIDSLDNFICDGCGSKVQSNDHVMECRPCNWGLCKRFCCVEATVLNPGDRVKSLCAEPSWTPRPLQIGDEGIVVENLPDCRVAVEFNGVTGWLYTANLQNLEIGDSGLWPARSIETPVDHTEQDNTIHLGA